MFGDLAGRAIAKAVAQLDRVAFRPDSLGADAVMALALLPPVLAGVILFRLPALEIFGLAVAVGAVVHLLARLLRLPLLGSPVLSALVGVALCGPATALPWPLAIAVLASFLELARARFWAGFGPRMGIHAGLLSYAILFVASGGAMAAYLKPAGMIRFPEPIHQWSRFYGGATHFLEPSTLYVGNVAGPVFATSLVAVAISLAWLWYARRLSLSVIVGFAVGGSAIASALHWDPVFQLDSGPAWFVVGIVLADRRLLPALPYARPVLGLAAGIIGVGLRAGDFYVEGLFLTVAAIQVVFSLIEGIATFALTRLRSRAELRPRAQKEPASA